MAASTDFVYEDYKPSVHWERAPRLDTLVIDLPGFRRHNLKVQLTTARNLRISAENQLMGNKWTQYQNEFSIPSDCDVNQITAKFDDGKLCVRLPKAPQEEIPEAEESATEREPEENDQEKTAKEGASKVAEDTKTAEEHAKDKGERVSPTGQEKEKTEREEMEKKTDGKGEEPESAAKTKETSGHGSAGTASKLTGNLLGKVEQPGKLLNFVLLLVVALVLVLYIKKGISSIGTPKND